MLRKKSDQVRDPLWVIGIDASLTSTGVYVMPLDANTDNSWHNITTTAKEGSEVYRIHRMANEICSFVSEYKHVAMVAIEDYGPINKFAGKVVQRAEICGIVKHTLHNELGIPFLTVPPKSLKSYACGNGNASKEDMVNRAKHFGFFTESHDEADAFHLARLAQALHRGARVGIAYQLFNP